MRVRSSKTHSDISAVDIEEDQGGRKGGQRSRHYTKFLLSPACFDSRALPMRCIYYLTSFYRRPCRFQRSTSSERGAKYPTLAELRFPIFQEIKVKDERDETYTAFSDMILGFGKCLSKEERREEAVVEEVGSKRGNL